MGDRYHVSVKESVLQHTSLTEDDRENVTELTFSSKADAESWVSDRNESLPPGIGGSLSLQGAHPNDESGADAYLIFRPYGQWVVDS